MRTTINILTIITAAAVLTGCEQKRGGAPLPPVSVTVASPQNLTLTNWDEYPGHVMAVEEVEVRARVSGYLDSIHFVDGSEVKANDLLFIIDPKPYEAELARAKAMRQQAETHLQLAKNDLQRAETLKAIGGSKAIAEEELDSRAKAEREAEDALKAAQAAEDTAQLNLTYTRVTAPVAGRMGQRLVTVGNLVQANGTPVLATIVSLSPIYCYFDVQEAVFAEYRRCFPTEANGKLSLAMPCELQLAGETGFPHRGRVDFFDNQVAQRTGTIRLRAVFANEDRSLVPGMFAKVRVPAGPPAQALTIPDVAIQADQNYKFVYVVDKEGKAEMRTVKIGRAHGPLRAVTEGLTPQDRVVVNGLAMLRRGAKVTLQGGPAQGTGAAEKSGATATGEAPAPRATGEKLAPQQGEASVARPGGKS